MVIWLHMYIYLVYMYIYVCVCVCIAENTLMKADNPVDAPTAVSILIYIHKESQVSILALVQLYLASSGLS